MGTVTLAARVLIALVFATAVVTKLPDPGASRTTFREFGVGEKLSRFAILLAPAELAVAIGLMLEPTARWAALTAAVMLLAFIAGMLNALRLGRRPDCGCFGGFRPTPIGRSALVRNGVLVAVAALILIAGPGPALDTWLKARSSIELVLISLLAATAGVAALHTLLRTRRHPRPDSQMVRSSPVHDGPKAGEEAPAFRLTTASGEVHTLDSFCSSDRPILLVFGTSGCGPCTNLFPHLSRWQKSLTQRLQLVVVAIGSLDEAEALVERHGLRTVIADRDGIVKSAYGIFVTPAAFAIAPNGKITNGPAIGQDAIEDLVRLTLHRDEPSQHPWTETSQAA